MEVLKFGGTSVGSAHGLSCVKNLVESKSDSVIVVVSALGGATDQLLRIAKIASENSDYSAEVNALKKRHFTAVDDSVVDKFRQRIKTQMQIIFDELEQILASVAVLEEISEKSSDLIVSYGERLSAPIVTGIFDDAHMISALDVFVTKQYFNKHIIDYVETNANIKRLNLTKKINVCSGFISKDKAGKRITNLGRGGSDYTAAIIASALNAKVLEIYTDVDGFLTSDPRVVENAELIKTMDFIDAIELCNYGAKVIYSPTIFPAFHKGIEIKIRNTFNAPCLGSSVTKNNSSDHITGISSVNDLSLINIVGNIEGLRYRLYKVLSGIGVEVFFGAKASFGVHSKDVCKAVNALEGEFSQELAMNRIDRIDIVNNLAMVAVVGTFSDILSTKSKVVELLKEKGIDVLSFGEDCSKHVVSYVVGIEHVRQATIITHSLIGVKPNQTQTVIENIVDHTIERLKNAGDVVHKVEVKGEYTFITTNRYRDFPLRVKH